MFVVTSEVLAFFLSLIRTLHRHQKRKKEEAAGLRTMGEKSTAKKYFESNNMTSSFCRVPNERSLFGQIGQHSDVNTIKNQVFKRKKSKLFAIWH
jgi:hypothetical protein